MGLRRALVDQARRVFVQEDPTGTWDEGSPPADTGYGAWFDVRFRPQAENEQQPPQRGGYTYVDEVAALLIGAEYQDGTPLIDPETQEFAAFDADDELEVQSADLGTSERWFVNGRARPIRKLRRVIGWRVDLRRSREPQVQEGPVPLPPGARRPDALDVLSDDDLATELG